MAPRKRSARPTRKPTAVTPRNQPPVEARGVALAAACAAGAFHELIYLLAITGTRPFALRQAQALAKKVDVLASILATPAPSKPGTRTKPR